MTREIFRVLVAMQCGITKEQFSWRRRRFMGKMSRHSSVSSTRPLVLCVHDISLRKLVGCRLIVSCEAWNMEIRRRLRLSNGDSILEYCVRVHKVRPCSEMGWDSVKSQTQDGGPWWASQLIGGLNLWIGAPHDQRPKYLHFTHIYRP